MGFLDKLGGLSKLAEIVGNPHQLPAIVAGNLPGATLTLGRMRLYQEIAGRAAILSMNANRLLTVALLQKRDVEEKEIQSFNAVETELLILARQLNNFPVDRKDMNLGKLSEAFGIASVSPPGAGETAGHTEAAAARNGHAGAVGGGP